MSLTPTLAGVSSLLDALSGTTAKPQELQLAKDQIQYTLFAYAYNSYGGGALLPDEEDLSPHSPSQLIRAKLGH